MLSLIPPLEYLYVITNSKCFLVYLDILNNPVRTVTCKILVIGGSVRKHLAKLLQFLSSVLDGDY